MEEQRIARTQDTKTGDGPSLSLGAYRFATPVFPLRIEREERALAGTRKTKSALRARFGGKNGLPSQHEQELEQEQLPIRRPDQEHQPAKPPHARGLAALTNMGCFEPVRAYWDKLGGQLHFKPNGAALPIKINCGRCIGCKAKHAQDWMVRCVNEAQLHQRNSFITLTYRNQDLPEDGSLVLDHWQKFAKRVRHHLHEAQDKTFRYFMCGEYGERNKRPHYHACIFGQDFKEDERPLGRGLYTSPTLQKLWKKGNVVIGPLTPQTAAYVARYVMKKALVKPNTDAFLRVDPDTGEYWEVKPEFISMSRRKGVAHDWIHKYATEVLEDDNVVIEGRKFNPPRYYDNQLPKETMAPIKERRQQRAEAHKEDNTPERLATKKRLAIARINQLKKEL